LTGTRSTSTTVGLFAILVVAWGLNYLFVPYGLQVASPLWLAWFRAAVGALGVLAIVRWTSGYGHLDARGRRDAMLIGIPNTAIFYGLWFTAARSIAPGETAVLVYTFPLWVAILSGPMLHDRVSAVGWGGIAAGFGGVVLISQPWAVSSHSASFVAILGAATSQISYSASKGGVLSMSRELGVQFARQGVRVNALCPGPVNTPLLQELFAKDPERAARRLVHVPMGRFGEPEEIAAAAAFLASDDASFITASTFLVDGGISAAYVTPL